MTLNAIKIHKALAYVHYWEHRDRGTDQVSRSEAAKTAVRILQLHDVEAEILANALHVSPEEMGR